MSVSHMQDLHTALVSKPNSHLTQSVNPVRIICTELPPHFCAKIAFRSVSGLRSEPSYIEPLCCWSLDPSLLKHTQENVWWPSVLQSHCGGLYRYCVNLQHTFSMSYYSLSLSILIYSIVKCKFTVTAASLLKLFSHKQYLSWNSSVAQH